MHAAGISAGSSRAPAQDRRSQRTALAIPIDQPLLPELARQMYAAAPPTGPCNLAHCAVVLPTRRAGRRLTEVLAERAAADKRFLTPPLLLTPGDLCDRIAAACVTARCATAVEECIAWMRALQDTADELAPLFGDADGAATVLRDPFAFACRLQRMHHELAGERVSFAAVAAQRRADEREHARWQALDAVARAYQHTLAAHGLHDRYAAREQALALLAQTTADASQVLAGCIHMYVAGVVDCFRQFTDMLAAVTIPVTIVTHQPAGADWLDTCGVLRPGMPPRDTSLDRRLEQIFIGDTPAEQARTVADLLARQDQALALTDIVIGVPDSAVARPLRDMLAAAGVPTHDAVGRAFHETELGLLLNTVANCLEDFSIVNFFRVVAHPVVTRWLAARLACATQAALDERLAAVRDFAIAHALDLVDEPRAETPADVAQCVALVQELLAPLHEPRRLHDWAEQFNAVLHALYAATDDVPAWADPGPHSDAIQAWCELMRAIAGSAVTHAALLGAPLALRRCLQWLEHTPLAPDASGVALDLVGWLDVACDDAPVVILTGMNDGMVPQVITSDPFLPDGLRAALGLAHNERRLNRDRYLLRTLLAGARQVYMLAGRFADNADPLKLSRVLCECSAPCLAQLLLRFYGKEPAQSNATAPPPPLTARAPITLGPPPDHGLVLPQPLTKLSVTRFSTYLTCPYQWYLQHTGVAPVHDVSCELDPRTLGTVLHEVLAHMPTAPLDQDALTARLCAALEQILRARFGPALHPAIALQAAACRDVLRAFAAQHCARHADGWRIAGPLERRISFTLDETPAPVVITGTIDRIDHQGSQRCIIDYKSGKTEQPRAPDGSWRDLQLPLYAFWLRHEEPASIDISCAYWRLFERDAIKLQELTDQDFTDAHACAIEIVTCIQRNDDEAFARTADETPCRICDYRYLCQRVL